MLTLSSTAWIRSNARLADGRDAGMPGCRDAPPTGLHSLLSVPWAGSRDPPTPASRDPTHRKRPPKPIQTPANIVCIERNLDLINTLRFVLYCHWRNWEQNQDSQWVLPNLPIQNPKPKLLWRWWSNPETHFESVHALGLCPVLRRSSIHSLFHPHSCSGHSTIYPNLGNSKHFHYHDVCPLRNISLKIFHFCLVTINTMWCVNI